jgi:hypothetical protein
MLLLGGLLDAIASRLMRLGKHDITFILPHCERCAGEKQELSIEHIDWENHRGSMLVHVDFAAGLDRLRSGGKTW